jgi:hypothetical protein
MKPTLLILVVITVLTSCEKSPANTNTNEKQTSEVVTADIQAGIEKHIQQQTNPATGTMNLPFEGKELNLKLVRVHTEYLANLAPQKHFACVDMAHSDGNVYDIDFFLEGDPGSMTVTETTVHKFNGKPYYVWKQKRNKTWHRAPAKDAPPKLLGVLKGTDRFDFIYRATLPEITQSAKMWLPMPSTDRFQTVTIKSVKTPGKSNILTDSQYGNKVLLLTLTPEDSNKKIEIIYSTERLEKPVYPDNTQSLEKYLKPENMVPADPKFKQIAQEVVTNKKGDLVRARALYDHTIDRMKYMKYGTGWGKGDALYACDAKTGNCTDFHSYFIALCRSVNIPARFAIGAAIPSERNSGGVDGYHCWAEFYTDGKWWPVDISEGDKCSSLSTYYFGHHPANRIELSKGRDLIVDPGPKSGPINFLAYPVLEIDGKPATPKVTFSFKRKI